jgi:phosphatidylglycerol---prolipoprotein diacylglyceryl transferase
MLPELFRIPWTSVSLPAYGVLLTAAFIVAIKMTAQLAERDGFERKTIYDLAFYVVPSALLGTKLLMTITKWGSFSDRWQLISFSLSPSYGAYFGGLLVSLGVSVILMHVWRLSWWQVADASAPGLALGNIIGRAGCFAGGCCWGKPTSSWIGVTFTERAHQLTGVPIETALIPTQLIEGGVSLLSFVFLLWLWRHRSYKGQVILAYLQLCSIERFTIDFLRDDPRGELLGLSTSQFIAVMVLPLTASLMISRRRGHLHHEDLQATASLGLEVRQ